MAKQTERPKEVTMSHTKKEMLAAYNELLEKLQEQEEKSLDGEEKIEQKNIEQALKVADALSTEGVVKEIGVLKAEIGTLLSQLSDELEGKVNKYNSIQKAIEAKENELKEIYEIERSVATLAALIEAQQEKQVSFEGEMAAKREELGREIERTRSVWKKEEELHDAYTKERDAAETKRRQREKEEFEYQFQREKKLAHDQFKDEKRTVNSELQARKEEVEKELTQREEVIAAREQGLEELRKRVESFPKEMETAVQKAVKKTTETLRLEAGNREELLKRESEGERNVLTTRIESLEKTIQEQNQQIAKLSQAQDNAYHQVQDIAVRAVEGASNYKSLATFQQFSAEQQKKASQEK